MPGAFQVFVIRLYAVLKRIEAVNIGCSIVKALVLELIRVINC